MSAAFYADLLMFATCTLPCNLLGWWTMCVCAEWKEGNGSGRGSRLIAMTLSCTWLHVKKTNTMQQNERGEKWKMKNEMAGLLTHCAYALFISLANCTNFLLTLPLTFFLFFFCRWVTNFGTFNLHTHITQFALSFLVSSLGQRKVAGHYKTRA